MASSNASALGSASASSAPGAGATGGEKSLDNGASTAGGSSGGPAGGPVSGSGGGGEFNAGFRDDDDDASSPQIVRLGPFGLVGEALGSQLETIVYRLAGTLQRIVDGTSTLARENARLLARVGDGWRTQLFIVLSQQGESLHIIGFHLEVGGDYVTENWPRIESEPPLVRPLMEALTEQVWWTLLAEYTGQTSWSPLLMLEWRAELSQRAGTGFEGGCSLIRLELDRGGARHTSRFRLVGGRELEQRGDRQQAQQAKDRQALGGMATDEAASGPLKPRATFPEAQASLEDSEQLHITLPLRTWWRLSEGLERNPTISEPHQVSSVRLESFSGVPLPVVSGWLGGELERLPRTIFQLATTFYDQPLRVHGLRSARREQIVSILQAALFSLLVSAVVVGVISRLSEPRLETERRLGKPAPLPALSFCSEDNQRFVNALRTWIVRFSPEEIGSAESERGDLTPYWCGLFDRSDSRSWNAGTQAAANACFDVLRTSTYGYTEQTTPPWAGPGWGNPTAFFDNNQTRVASLSQLVKSMRDSCRILSRQYEGYMSKTIVRSHLSDPLREVHPVLFEASDVKAVPPPIRTPVIWDKLTGEKARNPYSLASMGQAQAAAAQTRTAGEGEEASSDEEAETGLASEDRAWFQHYLRARFQPYNSERAVQSRIFKAVPDRQLPQDSLWSCYLSLLPDAEFTRLHAHGRPRTTVALGDWGVKFLFPTDSEHYNEGETVQSQLQLDGMLGWLEHNVPPENGGNAQAFQCWGVVRDELDRLGYQPVHTLLAPAVADWPLKSQQACTQVCQAIYGIWSGKGSLSSEKRASWLSDELDLTACVAYDRFREEPELEGGPALELDVSWANQAGPTGAQACAYHLLAQEKLITEDTKETPLMTIPARVWAGAGGGTKGTDSSRSFLVNYARQLTDFRRRGVATLPPRSVEGCQHVAAQCLTTAMLNTLHGVRSWERNSRYIQQIRLRFMDEVARGIKTDPFCSLISDELGYLMKNDFKIYERKAEDICLNRIASTEERLSSILDHVAWEQ